MRTLPGWLPLFALFVAACSAEHSPTAPPPVTRVPGGSVSRADIMSVGGAAMMFAIGHAINDSGLVVGYAATASLNPSGAAIWSPPEYVGEFLPRSPGMGYSEATAVANDGTVLGVECITQGSSCVPTIWRNGTITHLDALSAATDICPCDGETVIGASIVDGVLHATVAIQGFPLDAGVPDGFVSSSFTAIANGHIVGEAKRANGFTAAFRWTPSGGWVMLPLGNYGTVIDVNSHGDAIGSTADGNAFWPGDGSAPTIEPIGTFAALDDAGLVVGDAPITQFGPPGGELWRLDSGWQGNAFVGSQFVAINSQGSFLELVYGNAGIMTVVH
ncbi:MAG TPA: hypothetical protein VIR34_09230 [Gemmatimonadaceae bacterium]|jgi:hypothetical protein